MGRKTKQGIDYYPMESDHTLNKKIRLLVQDMGGDAYWVWSCICDVAYAIKGYYFDTTDEDEFDLFATEHCKKSTDFVKQVIATAIKRKLFNSRIYEETGYITSDRIQINYLYGTYERRRKGAQIFIQSRLLDLSPEKLSISAEKSNNSLDYLFLNVCIVVANDVIPMKNVFFPRKNEQIPQNNLQSRVEESRVDNNYFFSTGKHMEKQDFSAEKKEIEKIGVKVDRLGEFEIEIGRSPEDWQRIEVERFLTGNEIQFQKLAATLPNLNDCNNFKTVLQHFVTNNIERQNNYQKSFQLSQYFGRWIKPYIVETILNPKNQNGNGKHKANGNGNSEIGRTFTPD